MTKTVPRIRALCLRLTPFKLPYQLVCLQFVVRHLPKQTRLFTKKSYLQLLVRMEVKLQHFIAHNSSKLGEYCHVADFMFDSKGGIRSANFMFGSYRGIRSPNSSAKIHILKLFRFLLDILSRELISSLLRKQPGHRKRLKFLLPETDICIYAKIVDSLKYSQDLNQVTIFSLKCLTTGELE